MGHFKSVDSFTYLGIQITHGIEEIFQTNYDPVIASTHDSIERLSKLPISQIGRINMLKMSTLPKILYLFQNIPLPPPPNFFYRLKKLFCNFIWKNRRPMTGGGGGLKCPNLLWYCWASQLRTMRFYYSTENSPAWKDIESGSEKIPLPAYIYSDSLKNLRKNTTKPIVKNMIVVWYNVHKYLNEKSAHSRLSPIIISYRVQLMVALNYGLIEE